MSLEHCPECGYSQVNNFALLHGPNHRVGCSLRAAQVREAVNTKELEEKVDALEKQVEALERDQSQKA